MGKIDFNKIGVIVSIVVGLSSIGVFQFMKEKIEHIERIYESVDKIEALEDSLEVKNRYYHKVINKYVAQRKNDSVMIHDLYTKRKQDSLYIYWNYDWVVWLRKQHNH